MRRCLYAYPLVGATGLCNMFYPWARAVVWTREHGARVIAPNWVQFKRLGVWLRHEKDKRTYLRQFTDSGYITGTEKWWKLRTLRKSTESKPAASGIVVFSGREEFGWMEPVKNERTFLTEELERIVNPRILSGLKDLPRDYIAVHIRKGDFHFGDELQPDEYYLEAIKTARRENGEHLPVLVFSDAEDRELAFLSSIGNLKRMPQAPAVQDVLALSRATALVGTNHSTFSYWGAFLGRDKISYWSRLKHKADLPTDVCKVRYV